MSIFSKLNRAKKRADEEKAKKAAAESKAPPKAPYKHVPTHAAIDAVTGAPSSWKLEDKIAIKKQNERRRSQMSRNSSNLSQTTLHNTSINRNSSYNSADTFVSRQSQPRLETRRPHLAVQGVEGHEHQTPRHSRFMMAKSPLASNQISPVESEGNSAASSASSQILELPEPEAHAQSTLPTTSTHAQSLPSPHVHVPAHQHPIQFQQPYHQNMVDTYIEPSRREREPPLWERVAAQQPHYRPATQRVEQPVAPAAAVAEPVAGKRRRIWGRKSSAVAVAS